MWDDNKSGFENTANDFSNSNLIIYLGIALIVMFVLANFIVWFPIYRLYKHVNGE